ncbi:MAG: quinolinate synthase NadA [Candidatus Bathyarchaeia archaeon]
METPELQKEIIELKEENNAVLLVHNYQVPEVQIIGDYIGDSLELCRKAQNTVADDIVFCGVDFMAETAAILNPDKRVIHPHPDARCPMAAMLPMETLLDAKEAYVGTPAVLYVNTLAEAKAEADVVCTSSNAAEIVSKLDTDEVIFGPDRNLGYYVNKRVPEKRLIAVPAEGYCNVHRYLGGGEEALKLKERYPEAELLVHPECEPGLQDLADHVLSTGGMYRRGKMSDSNVFIIGTEIGLIQRMRREIPGKIFLPIKKDAECAAMKKITLKAIYDALKTGKPVVEVPHDIAAKARRPIERMLQMSS